MNTKIDIPDESTVAAVFDGVEPRIRASDEDREAVYSAVYREWTDMARQRKRSRRWRLGAVAASVLAAGVVLFNQLDQPSAEVEVAVIDQARGDVMVSAHSGSLLRPLKRATQSLYAGQQIKLVDGALGLRLTDGGSLRVARDTTLTLLANNTIRVDAGSIYFDSEAGDRHAGVVVKTPLGVVRDIGTQFAVRVAPSQLRVSVRSGAAGVDRVHHGLKVAHAGEQLSISASGDVVVDSVAVSGDDWAWAEELAPGIDLDSSTANDYLDWFARETGRTLKYADDLTRRAARTSQLAGGVKNDLTESALQLVLGSTRLSARIVGDMILVTTED